MTDPKVPGSKQEADAVRTAIAKYDLGRLEAAKAVLGGKKIEAALAEVKALLEEGLPEGTSIAANLPRLESWLAEVGTNLEADVEAFVRKADPEAAAAADAAAAEAGVDPIAAGRLARPTRPVPMLPAAGATT